MLKTRLRIWNTGSNLREGDVVEAIHIATRRQEEEGKKTDFIIRKKFVTRHDIVRYLSRRGFTEPKDFIRVSTKRGDPSLIEAKTPPPSRPSTPLLVDTSEVDAESSLLETVEGTDGTLDVLSLRDVQRVLFDNQLRLPVSAPNDLQLLNETLTFNNAYITSVFARPVQSSISLESLAGFDYLGTFTSEMWRGRDLLIEEQYQDAFKRFEEAFDVIQRLLASNNRGMLPELFEMLLNFQLEEQVDILDSLLRFIAQIPQTPGAATNFVSNIAFSLLRMRRSARLDAVERLMVNTAAHFSSNVGADHPESKSIQKALVRSVVRRMPVSDAIVHLVQLVEREETAPTMPLYDRCNALVEVALCFRAKHQLGDAAAWIQRAWTASEFLKSEFHRADIRVRCLRLMAYIEKKRANWRAAWKLAEDAVEMSEVGLGAMDSLTVLVAQEFAALKIQAPSEGHAAEGT